MAYKYLSPEWRDAVFTRLREKFNEGGKNPKATASLNNIYKNCPDGKDRYYFISIVDGDIDRIEIGEGEGPEAKFKIIGNYEDFAKCTRGEMNSQRALMCGKFKFKGNLTAGLKLAALSDRLNKISAEIPTEY